MILRIFADATIIGGLIGAATIKFDSEI